MRKVILGEIAVCSKFTWTNPDPVQVCQTLECSLYATLHLHPMFCLLNFMLNSIGEERRICCDGENILKPRACIPRNIIFLSITWIIYKLITDLLLFGQIPLHLNLSFQMSKKNFKYGRLWSASPVITRHPLLDQPWPIFFLSSHPLRILTPLSGLWLLAKS